MRAGQDHLEGARTVELNLAGLVNHAHAAASQLAFNVVAGYDRDPPFECPLWNRTQGGDRKVEGRADQGVLAGEPRRVVLRRRTVARGEPQFQLGRQ